MRSYRLSIAALAFASWGLMGVSSCAPENPSSESPQAVVACPTPFPMPNSTNNLVTTCMTIRFQTGVVSCTEFNNKVDASQCWTEVNQYLCQGANGYGYSTGASCSALSATNGFVGRCVLADRNIRYFANLWSEASARTDCTVSRGGQFYTTQIYGSCRILSNTAYVVTCVDSFDKNFKPEDCAIEKNNFSGAVGYSGIGVFSCSDTAYGLTKVGSCELDSKTIRYYSNLWTASSAQSDCSTRSGTWGP